MDTKILATFLKVVELKNFLRVSEELNYAPSTITTQIKKLEEELGAPVFDRIGKKVQLTSFGEDFLPYASKIVAMEKEVHYLGNSADNMHGTLRIGIIESFFNNILIFSLPEFIKNNKDISLSLRTGITEELINMLKKGVVDIIFCINAIECDKDFKCVYRKKENMIFATASNNPILKKKRITLKDILQEPLILSEKSSRYRRQLDIMASQYDIPVNPIVEIDSTRVMRKFVEQGLGITFLPEYILRHDIAIGKIAEIPITKQADPMWFQIYYNQNKWLSPAMKEMINFVIGVCKKEIAFYEDR